VPAGSGCWSCSKPGNSNGCQVGCPVRQYRRPAPGLRRRFDTAALRRFDTAAPGTAVPAGADHGVAAGQGHPVELEEKFRTAEI
jgi:hypothetical protein